MTDFALQRTSTSNLTRARARDDVPAAGGPAAVAPLTPATTPARVDVDPAQQTAARRGVATMDANVRRALEAQVPPKAPAIDREIDDAARQATTAVRAGPAGEVTAATGRDAEADQLTTMNGLRQTLSAAGGGTIAGYLRGKESAVAGATTDRARAFAVADLDGARRKVELLRTGYAQLQDGQVNPPDVTQMRRLAGAVEAQQTRIEALR